VIEKASAITRGSCRSASRRRAVIGAIASHPTNDSMSTVPAVPIADQPCGANGVQLSMRADGSAPTTATRITAVRRPTNPS
jgi:hypothetical protein